MNLLVLGWHMHRNCGDDAMLMHMIRQTKKYISNLNEVVLLSDGNSVIDEAVEGIKITHLFSSTRNRIYSRLCQRFLPYISALRADVIIIGGGSILHSEFGIKRRRRILQFSRLSRKKNSVYLLGVSVGPFANEVAEREFKKLYSYTDYTWVRDKKSYQYVLERFSGNNLEYVDDLGYCYAKRWKRENIKTINDKKKDSNGRDYVIGVSLLKQLTDIDPINTLKYLEILFSKINDQCRLHVILISLCSDDYFGDDQILSMLEDRLDAQSIKYSFKSYISPSDVLDTIVSCDLVIAMRMHAQIFATALNIPVKALNYHPKIARYFEGYPDNLVDIIDDPKKLLEISCDPQSNNAVTSLNEHCAEVQFPIFYY